MIQSYNDEIRNKKRKNIIFRIIVFSFASYLFLFFQGYYLNIDFNFITKEPQKVFKQFGIINILTLPEADNITINGVNYKNNSRSIFDFGTYSVKISDTESGIVRVIMLFLRLSITPGKYPIKNKVRAHPDQNKGLKIK